jgi:predicted Kef-type K+ transport protein
VKFRWLALAFLLGLWCGRSRGGRVVGVIVLVVLIAAWVVFTDERLSKQLDDLDVTLEEMIEARR